jgi:hypothetical protein
MRKRTMSVVVGALLAAASGAPITSVAAPVAAGAHVGSVVREQPTVSVSARSGREPVVMHVREGDGDVEAVVGSFDARLSSRGGADSGRIHMSWERVEGDRDTRVVVAVRISSVSVVAADAVEFEGRGRREDRATGQVVEFPVVGSARRDATAPDCVIFDIIGGSVHDGVVELPGRFDVST